MKMKWNWGTKLLISIIVFMLFLTAFFVLMMRQTFYLVEKDYYPKGLNYQQRIDKSINAKLLEEVVEIENNGEYLIFRFQSFFNPSEISGTIQLYRPSDAKQDVNLDIQPDSNRQIFYPVKNLIKGKYIAKINYTYGDKDYYQEKSVFIE